MTFLDEQMHVTPALFSAGQQSLTQAHQAFTARLCKAADVAAADSVLEIGGGWGALAMHAIEEHDCECARPLNLFICWASGSSRVCMLLRCSGWYE